LQVISWIEFGGTYAIYLYLTVVILQITAVKIVIIIVWTCFYILVAYFAAICTQIDPTDPNVHYEK
jgi:hypothetical protein